jgi:transposase
MNIKYRITLTAEERKGLQRLIATGKTQGYRIRHAHIVLALDEVPENKDWTDKKIAGAYQSTEKTIGNIRKRFVEEGLEAVLDRHARKTPPTIKIDGKTEAKIVALTCSEAPEGYGRWTLRLLAQKVVELGIMESVSHTAIADCLKKTKLSHGYKKNGVFQNPQRNLSSAWKTF